MERGAGIFCAIAVRDLTKKRVEKSQCDDLFKRYFIHARSVTPKDAQAQVHQYAPGVNARRAVAAELVGEGILVNQMWDLFRLIVLVEGESWIPEKVSDFWSSDVGCWILPRWLWVKYHEMSSGYLGG